MAEGGGLLNRYTGFPVSRVRIPLLPFFTLIISANIETRWGIRAGGSASGEVFEDVLNQCRY